MFVKFRLKAKVFNAQISIWSRDLSKWRSFLKKRRPNEKEKRLTGPAQLVSEMEVSLKLEASRNLTQKSRLILKAERFWEKDMTGKDKNF